MHATKISLKFQMPPPRPGKETTVRTEQQEATGRRKIRNRRADRKIKYLKLARPPNPQIGTFRNSDMPISTRGTKPSFEVCPVKHPRQLLDVPLGPLDGAGAHSFCRRARRMLNVHSSIYFYLETSALLLIRCLGLIRTAFWKLAGRMGWLFKEMGVSSATKIQR